MKEADNLAIKRRNEAGIVDDTDPVFLQSLNLDPTTGALNEKNGGIRAFPRSLATNVDIACPGNLVVRHSVESYLVEFSDGTEENFVQKDRVHAIDEAEGLVLGAHVSVSTNSAGSRTGTIKSANHYWAFTGGSLGALLGFSKQFLGGRGTATSTLAPGYLKAFPEGWALDLREGDSSVGTLLNADAITFFFHFQSGMFGVANSGAFLVDQERYFCSRGTFSQTVPEQAAQEQILSAFEKDAVALVPLSDAEVGSTEEAFDEQGGADGQCPFPEHSWRHFSTSKTRHLVFSRCKAQFKKLIPDKASVLKLARGFKQLLGATSTFAAITDKDAGLLQTRHPKRRSEQKLSKTLEFRMQTDMLAVIQPLAPEHKPEAPTTAAGGDPGDDAPEWQTDTEALVRILDAIKMRNLGVAYALTLTEEALRARLKEKDDADVAAHLTCGHTKRQIINWHELHKGLPPLGRSRMNPPKVREAKRSVLEKVFGLGQFIIEGLGLGGQPLACVNSIVPMLKTAMSMLEDGFQLGILPTPDERYLTILRENVEDLPDDAPEVVRKLASLPREAGPSELADALNWGSGVVDKATYVKGGWRVRLTMEARPSRTERLLPGVVVTKYEWVEHGSGFEMSIDENRVVVTDYPDERSLSADAVAEHLAIDGGGALVSSAVRRDRGLVVVTLTEEGVAQRAELVRTRVEIHDLHVQMVTKGWDAFPWKSRPGHYGETIAAAMIHIGIRGLERSTLNTLLVGVVEGDDSHKEFRSLDQMCGITKQYDQVCENPMELQVPLSMFDPDNVPNGGPTDVKARTFVVFCGPTVPDAKAAFQLQGQKMFAPYLCPLCTATWKTGCSHEHATCPSIDHSSTVAYLAGIINVVAVEFQQQVKLEVYLHDARTQIPGLLERAEAVSEDDSEGDLTEEGVAAGVQLQALGEELLPICESVKTDVVDGKVVLESLRTACKDLAQHMNPDSLLGTDADPGYILTMLSNSDLIESFRLAGGDAGALPKKILAPQKKKMRAEITVALETNTEDAKTLAAFIRKQTNTAESPTRKGKTEPLRVALDNALSSNKYFGSSTKPHPAGLRGAVRSALHYFGEMMAGLSRTAEGLAIVNQNEFPPHLQADLKAALEIIIPRFNKVKEVAESEDADLYEDTDLMLLTACRQVLAEIYKVLPKSTDGAKNGAGLAKKFNAPEGLNGLLYQTLLENTGAYYPGVLHQGYLRSGGWVLNTIILDGGRSYDRLRAEQQKGEQSPHYELLKNRNFEYGPAVVLGTVKAQVTDWLVNPKCGLVLQIIEDPFSGALRTARTDAQRIHTGLHRDYHDLFGDPVFSYFVKHLLHLWRYSLSVMDSPLPVVDILEATGEEIFQEVQEAHDQIYFLMNMLRPPRLSRRDQEWWVHLHTLSLHIYLQHSLDLFKPSFRYGHINEYCFEQKHCNTKRCAHNYAGNMGRIVENMAVADLSKFLTAVGRKEILAHIRRNYEKHFSPSNVKDRTRERADAKESLRSLQACRRRAEATEEVLATWEAYSVGGEDGIDFSVGVPGPCDDVVVQAIKNMFVEPDFGDPGVFNNLPTFPLSGANYHTGWLSPPWLYGALVQPKAERNKDLEADLPVDSEGALLTQAGLGGFTEAVLGDDDSSGNVDDGCSCEADQVDETRTPCHQDEDELLDEAEEQERNDDMLEDMEEALLPQGESEGRDPVDTATHVNEACAGEGEDEAAACAAAEEAAAAASSSAQRARTRAGRAIMRPAALREFEE